MWHYKEIEGSYCLVDDCDQDHVLYIVDMINRDFWDLI